MTIYYDHSLQKPAFLSDLLEEQYEMEGNKAVGFKGFIQTRCDGISLMDMNRLDQEVKESLKGGDGKKE